MYIKNSEEPVTYYRNTQLSPDQWLCFNTELQYLLACNLSYNFDDVNKINVKQYASDLTTIYKSLIDKYMPQKRKTRKQKKFDRKPWITQGLRISIDKKDELYRLSKKGPVAESKYKAHSDLLVKL